MQKNPSMSDFLSKIFAYINKKGSTFAGENGLTTND